MATENKAYADDAEDLEVVVTSVDGLEFYHELAERGQVIGHHTQVAVLDDVNEVTLDLGVFREILTLR